MQDLWQYCCELKSHPSPSLMCSAKRYIALLLEVLRCCLLSMHSRDGTPRCSACGSVLNTPMVMTATLVKHLKQHLAQFKHCESLKAQVTTSESALKKRPTENNPMSLTEDTTWFSVGYNAVWTHPTYDEWCDSPSYHSCARRFQQLSIRLCSVTSKIF